MKLLHIAFFFLFGVALHAQSVANLNYGTTIAIDEVDIKFVEVLEDSRCPKNVNCVQAGRAVVLVSVFVHGNFVEERRLEFHPGGFNNQTFTTLFNANGLRITGFNLIPYPVTTKKTLNQDYYLELGIN